MRRHFWLAMVVALLAALLPVSAAQAAPRCFGRTPTIVGTKLSNRLVGTPGPDVIVGGNGTDRIDGRGGNDRICDGAGEDQVRGGGGNDRLHAGEGDESGRGSHLYGGAGDDLLVGSKFDGEKLDGGEGNDTLRAFGSNRTYEDLLVGGPGDDALIQGPGPSDLVPGPGNDLVDGGRSATFPDGSGTYPPPDAATDILDLRAAPASLKVDLAAGTATGEGNDEIDNVETVIGSPFDDTLVGGGTECCFQGDVRPVDENLFGMGGNDIVAGREGDDCLIGDHVDQFGSCYFVPPTQGAGNDQLLGGPGDDLLQGGGGDDRYVGERGQDRVSFIRAEAGVTADLGAGQASGEGSDTLRDIEILVGSLFADVLVGDEGDNTFSGDQGSDRISGAGGNDTFELTPGHQPDVMEGGAGSDTVHYDCSLRSQTIDVDLQAGSDSLGDTLSEIENVSNCLGTVRGDDGPNRLTGAGELLGLGGDDVITGGSTDDVLDGGDGHDVLDGSGGSDSCTEGETVVNCEGP